MGVGIKICSGPMLERTGDLVAFCRALSHAIFFLLMKFIACPLMLKKCFIAPWNIFVLMSLLAKALAQNQLIYPFIRLPSSAQPPKVVCFLRRCAADLALLSGLIFITMKNYKKLCSKMLAFLELSFRPEAALLIAKSSRGTPRTAKKIVRRVRDFAQVLIKIMR